ncbi:MAG: polysaccharide biosynthesis tyrosine autokinase [Desulfococcaceae bacterium]
MMKKKDSDKHIKLKEYTLSFLDSSRTKSRFAEAYRTLRTNIHFSVADRRVRSILLTSASQSEGKTVTTANLAFTISQTGKSVLIIDGDLRKPMLSKLFNAKNIPGLTGLLNDMLSADIRNGVLEEMSISDLFRIISLQKRTGILSLKEDREEVELHFVNGQIAEIEWITRPDEKKLANMLVKDRNLSRENAEIVLDRQKDTGQKLGHILVSMGLISEKDLRGIMSLHTAESFRVIARMKSGSFTFSERPESRQDLADPVQQDLEQMCEQVMGKEEDMIWLNGKIASAIVQTEVPGLSVLPSGVIPPNPSEMLGSERMSFLIRYLEKRFDFMLIDTPPILPASDALMVAPQVGGVVLVVKAGLLSRKMVKKAVEQLQMAKANILGVVLNRVDVKREGYYNYYQKYYSNYYSEDK